MTAVTAPAGIDAVRAALATVRDPELDESITDLDFVADIRAAAADVEVDLRLPTYFCAPNFAYLMVADAYDAVRAVRPGGRVVVRLLDHFAADEINAGVASGGGFDGAFPGLADGGLAELRLVFQRKAHLAAQERAAVALVRAGWAVPALVDATIGDLPASEQRDRLVRRRRELGLPDGPAAPLLLEADGRPMTAGTLPTRLRFARTTRVSIEANADLCRGLLDVRYRRPAR